MEGNINKLKQILLRLRFEHLLVSLLIYQAMTVKQKLFEMIQQAPIFNRVFNRRCLNLILKVR